MITTGAPPRPPVALSSSSTGRVGVAQFPKSRSSGRGPAERAEVSISSPSNPLVKHCVKLRESSSYRRSRGSAVVVGLTPISEIMCFPASEGCARKLLSPSLIDCLFILEGNDIPTRLCDDSSRIVHVNTYIMKKLAGLKNADSTEAVAVLRIPDSFCELDTNSWLGGIDWFRWLPCAPHRVLVLDGVQDPGNLGTLIRSAMAFKWDSIFLLPGCCDPFNEKALRAARGSSFQVPMLSGGWSQLEDLRDRFQMKMLGAYPMTEAPKSITACTLSRELVDDLAQKPLCLVLGNEGQGISEQSRNRCELVSIPMAGQFKSLNVSVAGGIFLYMLQNQRSQ